MKQLVMSLMSCFLIVTRLSAQHISDTTIYVKVDTEAQYPGGINALADFISKNVVLPTGDQGNISGPLSFSFVIEKNGSVSDGKVLKGFTPAINASFITALCAAQRWSPAKVNGKPVRQQVFLSMNFENRTMETGSSGTEHAAEYPGGLAQFYDNLSSNIRYPAKAKAEHLQGKVTVSFNIDTDGSLTDIKIEKSLSPEADEEVVRLIKGSKKWQPKQLGGKSVKQKFNISIPFQL